LKVKGSWRSFTRRGTQAKVPTTNQITHNLKSDPGRTENRIVRPCARSRSETEVMPDKILSVDAVLALVPYCRMQLFRKVKDGTFPAPLQLGARRIGWRESDITTWQQS